MLEERLWELLDGVAADRTGAWPALMAELEPELVALAKHQPIGRLRDREDSPREIATRVLVRLHARDHAVIRRLCALEPRPELGAWLRVLVRRSAVDYMRASPEYERGNARRADRWISLATLSSRQAGHDVDTLAEKRREVLAFVGEAVARARTEVAVHGGDAVGRLALEWKIDRTHVRRLIARRGHYLAVLAAVLEGHSYPEVATVAGLTRREVELTVRYIEDLLEARGFARAG